MSASPKAINTPPSDAAPGDIIMGIDEAGRGPVLGPMVYGAAFCRAENYGDLRGLGAADSKVLTADQRDSIAATVRKRCHKRPQHTHTKSCVMAAEEISERMMSKHRDSLNVISHEAAAWMVAQVLFRLGQAGEEQCSEAPQGAADWEAGPLKEGNVGRLHTVFVDTVGPPQSYQALLERKFPDVKFVVTKKADSLHPIVGIASIMAKTNRDLTLQAWPKGDGGNTGSGYPADPATKSWLDRNCHHVFGFEKLVRFSWLTAIEVMKKRCCVVDWGDQEEEDITEALQRSAKRQRRHPFDALLSLESVT